MKLIDIIRDKIPEGTFWTHSKTIIDGCTPVSPGCKNCWLAGIYRRNLPGMKTYTEMLTPGGCFNGIVMERPDRLDGIIPKRPRKPRVWTYWSDVFHPGVSDAFRTELFDIMHDACNDHHIIITKRPENAVSFLGRNGKHYPNVVILVTMEDQQRASERGPYAHRLTCMGWNVGILAEPLLSDLNLAPWICDMKWLITGGESGHNARPAHPDWFRSLRDQATAAGVPFMLKSLGAFVEAPLIREWKPGMDVRGLAYDGREVKPSDRFDGPAGDRFLLRVRAAGRILDGRTWDEVPDL